MKTKLRTTADDLSLLWQRVGELRADAQVVKVEPLLLQKLLFDHQTMFELCKSNLEG